MSSKSVTKPKINDSSDVLDDDQRPLNKPNMSCINGIRCLCCLWIVFLHTHAFSAVFPWSSPSMTYVREFPVLGFFAISTLAVDVFWFLSGFLCEYQLNYQVDKSKTLWPLWFILNRLLRLYPLYLLSVLMVVTSPMNFKCKTSTQIIKAVFFMEIFTSTDGHPYEVVPPACSGAGWSVNVDVHGYIVIVILFIVLGSNTYKKYIMWGLYIFSCILTIIIAFKHNISWPVALYGLEAIDPELYEEYFKLNPEVRDQFPNPMKFYPDFDLMTPQLVSYRERSVAWLYELYFTSIAKHGAAMFLGSILAMNFRANYKKNAVWIDLVKIIIGFIAFYLTMDLRMDIEYRSPIWTFAYDKLFIVAVYLFLDAILSISQYDGNVLEKMVDFSLGNKMWKFLAPYTYGIYLFHIIPIFGLVFSPYPLDVENGGIGEDNYGYLFIGKVAGIAVVVGFIISIICYWIFEYPTMLFRYKYIRPRYIKDAKKKKSA